MDTVRDLLDMPVADARGNPVGRVDGIVAVHAEGRPLRLEAIELGGSTLARRIHPRLGRWIRALAARVSPTRGRVCRFSFGEIRIGRDGVRLKSGQAPGSALAWERWLRRSIIERIPGG